MRSQAMGLAEAVGLPIVEKRIGLRPAWSRLPAGLLPMPLSALRPDSDPLAPPWPRLVVTCGRRSIDIVLTVKRLSGGTTRAVYIQNPKLARRGFDLIVAMPHDGVTGRNVVTIPTALHLVTQDKLAVARREWEAQLGAGGAPLLGVLIGGDNASYRLTDAVATQLVGVLRNAHRRHGLTARITPSRRTDERTKRFIAEAVASEPLGTIWDECGANPYLGILGLADRLVVTGESISMVSEALAAGRPVHVLRLAGRGRRHEAFLDRLAAQGLISLIEGEDLDWDFQGQPPIDSMAEPAARLCALLGIDKA